MKKFLTIFLAVLLLVTIFAGCSASGPSKKQIKEDAQDFLEDQPYLQDEKITKIEIEFADCKDGIYEAQIIIYYDYTQPSLGGKKEKASEKQTVYVKYRHYSKGGWKLLDIDD